MQTRTIPSDTYPWWSCKINHKEYKYPSGATMSVPDVVAELIDNINAASNKPAPAEYFPTLPVPSEDDNGKSLLVRDGRYVLEQAPVPEPQDFTPIELDADISIEDGTVTVALDIKAAALYNAIAGGKLVKIQATNLGGEYIGAMTAFKAVDSSTGSYTYQFGFFNEFLSPGVSEALGADDDVVLTYETQDGT